MRLTEVTGGSVLEGTVILVCSLRTEGNGGGETSDLALPSLWKLTSLWQYFSLKCHVWYLGESLLAKFNKLHIFWALVAHFLIHETTLVLVTRLWKGFRREWKRGRVLKKIPVPLSHPMTYNKAITKRYYNRGNIIWWTNEWMNEYLLIVNSCGN